MSYAAHLAGFISGLLVGLMVLRNLRKLAWERVIKWTGFVIYLCLISAAIVINVVFYKEFGMAPPTQSSSTASLLAAPLTATALSGTTLPDTPLQNGNQHFSIVP